MFSLKSGDHLAPRLGPALPIDESHELQQKPAQQMDPSTASTSLSADDYCLGPLIIRPPQTNRAVNTAPSKGFLHGFRSRSLLPFRSRGQQQQQQQQPVWTQNLSRNRLSFPHGFNTRMQAGLRPSNSPIREEDSDNGHDTKRPQASSVSPVLNNAVGTVDHEHHEIQCGPQSFGRHAQYGAFGISDSEIDSDADTDMDVEDAGAWEWKEATGDGGLRLNFHVGAGTNSEDDARNFDMLRSVLERDREVSSSGEEDDDTAEGNDYKGKKRADQALDSRLAAARAPASVSSKANQLASEAAIASRGSPPPPGALQLRPRGHAVAGPAAATVASATIAAAAKHKLGAQQPPEDAAADATAAEAAAGADLQRGSPSSLAAFGIDGPFGDQREEQGFQSRRHGRKVPSSQEIAEELKNKKEQRLRRIEGSFVHDLPGAAGGGMAGVVSGATGGSGGWADRIQPVNIVMMVVGTRGDVQPFIGIGQQLKEYGHRVRLASHKNYRSFVEKAELEFFPLGGDPKVLSEFVVKHRGINPGINLSDMREQREQIREITFSCWDACTKPDPEHPDQPFTPDVIVANPAAYGHIHVAQRLQVPLHMVFTMPWSPTGYYPCPFVRLTQDHGDHSRLVRNMYWLSYFAMEALVWLGIKDIIAEFRASLELPRASKYTGAHGLYYSKVPFSYIFSPTLIPRPDDWQEHIRITGFVKVDVKSLTDYEPPKEVVDFLEAGAPPIFISFGSLVIPDAKRLTSCIIKAVQATGMRAIIQKGWGGLGEGINPKRLPKGILIIEQCAHDWLFPRCAAVIHHGGAGTTATGLYAGKPTCIIPFFGDQPFWGAAVHANGLGPAPIPIDSLNTKRLVKAIMVLCEREAAKNAAAVAELLSCEDGTAGTIDHIHRTIYSVRLGRRRLKYLEPIQGDGSENSMDTALASSLKAQLLNHRRRIKKVWRGVKKTFSGFKPSSISTTASAPAAAVADAESAINNAYHGAGVSSATSSAPAVARCSSTS